MKPGVALGTSDPPQVVDVRDPWEWEVAQIVGSHLIPLSALGDSIKELDPRRDIVTVCRHGVRSLTAQRLLRGAGFGRVKAWGRHRCQGGARRSAITALLSNRTQD